MNHVIFIGRITRELELKQSKTGMSILKFSLAVNRKTKAGEEKKADFINMTAFGKTAEFIEKYMAKGMQIAISGRLQVEPYTNKEGKKVYDTSVLVDEVNFADGKKEPSNDSKQVAVEWDNIGEDDNAELPF